MKRILLLWILLMPVFANAQEGINILPWPTSPNSNDSTLCVLSQNDSVYVHDDFFSFHTQNNLWDGPIDSNYCLNIAKETATGIFIYHTEVDSARPIFIEPDLGSNGILLEANTNYRFLISPDTPGLIDTDCSDSICSKLYLQIRKPNSTMTGDTVVVWELNVIQTQQNKLYACFVTEKFFNEQYLERLVFKAQPVTPLNSEIRFGHMYFEYPMDVGFTNLLNNSNFSNYYFGASYELAEFLYFSQYIAVHDEPGYPSTNNIHYIDVVPVPNTSASENVQINITGYSHLAFQPFTEFRGGEVQGGGDFHTYTINNMGAEMCLMPFLEIKFADGNTYLHGGGDVQFGGNSTCMLFDNGGRLEVAAGERFEYGQKSVGMLGLHSGGEIHLNENSELIIHNMAVMSDDIGENSEGVHVYMKPGSKLSFSEGAALKDWSNNATMKLIVHVDRSWIDLTALNAAERALVEIVYDDPVEDQLYLTVWDNPISGEMVAFEFMNYEGMEYQVELFDLKGNHLLTQDLSGDKGMNTENISIPNLPAGMYVLKLRCNSKIAEERFAKL